MTDQLIILIVLVMISAFFSGSELAFVVANKLKIEIRARKKNFAAKAAYSFVRNPQYFFSAHTHRKQYCQHSFCLIKCSHTFRCF